MYITAQRVRTRDKREGINAFLFLHSPQEALGISWSPPDIELIADQHPGTLILQRLEQDYGMNDVLSYLDVAAPDSFDPERIRTIIASTDFDPTSARIWSTELVSFRFFYSNANYHDVATEYIALRDRTLSLLPPRQSARPESELVDPLRIIAEDNEGLGIVYHLDSVGQQRLRHHNPKARDAKVRVAYEQRKQLVALWGDAQYHQEIALVVTGVSASELALLGGATILDTGDQLGSTLAATIEELPRQVSGDWVGPGESIEDPIGWPTGAILPSGNLALDLVYIERAWYPLSEAGLYTYLHSTGLVAGEPWRFVTRSSPRTIYRVHLGPTLTRSQVIAHYGAEAGTRCRDDRLTVQLQLSRE